MAERPIVRPEDRMPAPPTGAPGLMRVFAVLQTLMAAGMFADWLYGDFRDATKLASGLGFALMAPSSWFFSRSRMPQARLLRAACAIGIVLAIGATLVRAFVLNRT